MSDDSDKFEIISSKYIPPGSEETTSKEIPDKFDTKSIPFADEDTEEATFTKEDYDSSTDELAGYGKDVENAVNDEINRFDGNADHSGNINYFKKDDTWNIDGWRPADVQVIKNRDENGNVKDFYSSLSYENDQEENCRQIIEFKIDENGNKHYVYTDITGTEEDPYRDSIRTEVIIDKDSKNIQVIDSERGNLEK
jgi:hypothetical protein